MTPDQAEPSPEISTEASPQPAVPRVNWDDSKMVTTFANAVNVLATREEMTIMFGSNQTWNAAELRELTIQLTNRIVLNPHAAKRLLLLLAARMREYEQRFGTINL
jgi:hypothetical protein